MPEGVHLLTHEFPPFTGGIGVYVEETASALARADILTTVWAPDYGTRNSDAYPFKTHRIGMRGKQDWMCRINFAKALRAGFPQRSIPGTVVLAEPGPIRLWMYREWMRLPQPDRLIVILHGSEVRLQSGLAHRRHLFRGLLKSADCIGVVSEAVRDTVLEVSPEVSGKLVLVPGAVRHAWQILPAVERPHPAEIREILQVGRIHPRKGQAVLVEALALLPEEVRRSVRLRLIGPVGSEDYCASLKRRISDLKLPVVLEGILPETSLRSAYETASVVVMPSQPFKTSIEGLGMALLEAQHFGCPVIGSRIGGVGDALEDGTTGYLVPPGNPRELTLAIQKILADPDMGNAMGRAGSLFVRKRFSWAKNIAQLGLA